VHLVGFTTEIKFYVFAFSDFSRISEIFRVLKPLLNLLILVNLSYILVTRYKHIQFLVTPHFLYLCI